MTTLQQRSRHGPGLAWINLRTQRVLRGIDGGNDMMYAVIARQQRAIIACRRSWRDAQRSIGIAQCYRYDLLLLELLKIPMSNSANLFEFDGYMKGAKFGRNRVGVIRPPPNGSAILLRTSSKAAEASCKPQVHFRGLLSADNTGLDIDSNSPFLPRMLTQNHVNSLE